MTSVLRQDETAVLELRELYERYGYKKYKMSKFENYDLYLENKNFLSSERIVTFSASGGKLMALKPDITLSIIKNAPRNLSGAYKTYYNENVYRAVDSSEDIKEIMQVGIEYIGCLDLYSECEVLALAARSLRMISNNSIIGISHMGIIASILGEAQFSAADCEAIRCCIADKNVHTLKEICRNADKADVGEKLAQLAMIYGPVPETMPRLKEICSGSECISALKELEDVMSVLDVMGEKDSFALDFSVSNDMDYYNGIIFQGFIDGIPRHVLSGGRYDGLVRKMGVNADAVGFAVYPDLLERLSVNDKIDVDVLLVYGDTDAKTVAAKVEELSGQGKKVCAVRDVAENMPTYKEMIRIQ